MPNANTKHTLQGYVVGWTQKLTFSLPFMDEPVDVSKIGPIVQVVMSHSDDVLS